MKLQTTFRYLVVLLLFISACKKKDKEESPAPQPAPTTPAEEMHGLFLCENSAQVLNNVLQNSHNNTGAFFNVIPMQHYMPQQSGMIDMGKITLNGTQLKNNEIGLPGFYVDTTIGTIYTPPLTWVITGTNSVPSLTMISTNPFPTYTGYSSIPDSVTISQGVNVTLTNYDGCDEIEVGFERQSLTHFRTPVQYIVGHPPSVNFTSQDLAAVGTATDVVFRIQFHKNNKIKYNGKDCNFRTSYFVYKTGIKFK